MEHLQPTTAEKLALTDAERIEYIRQPRWIPYPRANEILTKLDELLVHPKQARMPNMLLAGETNNGKTVLIERFCAQHRVQEKEDGSGVVIPVLYMQAPPGPDERALYDAILNRLFQRSRSSEAAGPKRDRIVNTLKHTQIGMLVIDELHHLIAGSTLKQRNFLNVLKYLGTELRIPIVGVGTRDALLALSIDPQLENRFLPEILERWTLDADFRRLLASFESLLPLKESSKLADKDMASRILAMTGGTIGELSRLLNEAAIYAIKKKTEKIDADVLASCSYQSPSARKAAASRL